MITVAVIDDGVCYGLCGADEIEHCVEITSDLEVQDVGIGDIFLDTSISHSTICVAIIKKYYPDAKITSIKVLDEKSHKGKKEQLIKAIEWCINNGIQVVNISLGTVDYRDFKPIRDVVDKAYNKGIIIVAACNNKDIFTYPASYTNVIGVKCCKNGSLKEGEYIFNLYPIDGIEITSCSEHKLLKSNLETKITNKCNSYAAPMITAQICKIINKFSNITFDKIKRELYADSINYTKSTLKINNFKNLDWICKAALINTSEKEEILQLAYPNIIIKKNDEINIDLFDTLILLNNNIDDYKKLKSIMYQFEKKQKNIIVINTEYRYKDYEVKNENNIKFWDPSIVKHFYEGYLPKKKIDVPIIIIYDYSDSKLIKLLKVLTDKFRDDGYNAAGICTNPISILYMLEYIPVDKERNFIQIKDKLEALYKVYDYDIIILGLSIHKEDTNKVKELSILFNSDISIFLVDDFTYEVKKCIQEISIENSLIIMSQYDINKYSCLAYKLFGYKDLDLLYEYILQIFNCENSAE